MKSPPSNPRDQISASSSSSKRKNQEDLIDLCEDEQEVISLNKDVLEDHRGDSSIFCRDFTEDKLKRRKLANLLANESEHDGVDSTLEKSPNQQQTGKISYTPLEKQVVTLRQQYTDCILMVECGYRMRFFGTDAEVASKVLSIYSHQDHNFLVASVPTHRAFIHCQRLLTAGYKVTNYFLEFCYFLLISIQTGWNCPTN